MNCINWDKLAWDVVMPGMRRKVLHADGFSMVLVDLTPNLDLPVHDHDHAQATLVQKGALAFTLGGETRLIGPGDVIRIPPNTAHGAVVQDQPALIMDIFVPRREEFPASVAKTTGPETR